ncbi:MAG: hypothetical protein HRU29_04470 [Rhizobiales bacterium]|nr:hypothetical protein [Hyphomicrobiales bacterium]NRB13637.1 hypothetical protein [Hyphomicrobiales bacterium]
MDKTIELAHVVSPNFYFTVNSNFKQSFEVYAKNFKIVKQDSELTISEVRIIDDQIIEVDYTILLLIDGEYQKTLVTGQFFVADGLIQHVNLDYHQKKEEFTRFQNTLFGLGEPQLESYFL